MMEPIENVHFNNIQVKTASNKEKTQIDQNAPIPLAPVVVTSSPLFFYSSFFYPQYRTHLDLSLFFAPIFFCNI